MACCLQHPEKEELSQESADKVAAQQEERTKQAGMPLAHAIACLHHGHAILALLAGCVHGSRVSGMAIACRAIRLSSWSCVWPQMGRRWPSQVKDLSLRCTGVRLEVIHAASEAWRALADGVRAAWQPIWGPGIAVTAIVR